MTIELLNIDCMEYMAGLPDKAFDIAIVDPPYGGFGDMRGILTKETEGAYKLYNNVAPSPEYFIELARVSKNQIVWGGNYFTLPVSRGWIYWNKQTPTHVFADGELAWTSFDKNLKCFDFMWTNVKQGLGSWMKSNKPANMHPTQKPIELYEWLLTNYAKPGQRILDTHLGSGSSAIAAHNLGFDFVGTELDADYYAAAVKRFEQHKAQGKLFDVDDYDRVTRDYKQVSML